MGMGMEMERLQLVIFITLLSGYCFHGGSHAKQKHSSCQHLILPSGYPCSQYTIETKDGFLLGLQRVSSSSSSFLRVGNDEERGPPVLLLHGLFMGGDAWFLNSREQSLGFILADRGFDVWVGNVRGIHWSHGHISILEKNKHFWDWSWQELALYDLAGMINYINSVTNSKLFLLGNSQGTIMSFAVFSQPEMVEKVKAAALLSPISYLDHASTPCILKMVKLHLDQLILAMGVHQLNFERARLRGTTPTLLHHNVLARAEDKARGPTFSSSSSSLFEPQQSSQQQNLMPESGTCDPRSSLDKTSSQDFEDSYQPKTDLFKFVVKFAVATTEAVAINHSWVAANQDLAMGLLFVIGYASIIFEEYLAFSKSGVGLLMAVSLWVIRSIGAPSTDIAVSELTHASAEVSEIVLFLLGAMTIVEIIDVHQGFKLVTDNIMTRNPRLLLWVIGFITFFLGSVLDNLTSTIVMVSMLRKLVPPSEYRKILGAVVVMAANAGGAWTPIGDVTTTMLWIHGQISTVQTMKGLFVPSAISLAVPLALMSLTSEVNGKGQDFPDVLASEQIAPRGRLVFSVGFGALIFVPVFRALTGLPPYMGMLLGLGMLWILTDAIHYGESERQKLKVPQALSKIDTQGALFFLGILLSISSLEAAGILREIANYLDAHVPSSELIAIAIGLVSAVIDNVPLVAATMGMYDVSSFPQDSEFWQLIAFCASTGGSILIIGSAAGVAFMGMEKVDFIWYLRKVSGFAFAGYAAGVAAYLAVHVLIISLPTLAEDPFLSGS
ncbi:hypothetical protein VNO77_12249 [Canavalia gladiata]|uniref:Citrate transporter-like domain-containing protein n=1 Tax=Canavalia gladiata TaxID=3824 RepID=A0AAN9M1C2_CANGL